MWPWLTGLDWIGLGERMVGAWVRCDSCGRVPTHGYAAWCAVDGRCGRRSRDCVIASYRAVGDGCRDKGQTEGGGRRQYFQQE